MVAGVGVFLGTVEILKVPYGLLFPMILLLCLIGAYTVNNSTTDVTIMLVSGVIGYLMKKFDYEPALAVAKGQDALDVKHFSNEEGKRWQKHIL